MRCACVAVFLFGCGGNAPSPAASDAANPPAGDLGPAAPDDAGAQAGDLGGGSARDLGAAARDLLPAHDLLPACAKHLTVVFSVGTGSSEVAGHTNGCWDAIDADGAANHEFRKCSTNNMIVENPSAPNYAFDDTNPTQRSQDQTFLAACSKNAAGIGFEYMAYRAGSWLVLGAPHLVAYFAELYSDDLHVGDYQQYWQTPLDGQTVYPMINMGPNAPTAIHDDALAWCKKIADKGYFGVYNADWSGHWTASDPRATALASALNSCTGK